MRLSVTSLGEIKRAFCGFAAKSSGYGIVGDAYLPLWMHAVDTCEVSCWLYPRLISPHIQKRLEEQLAPLCPEETVIPLLGLLHDLGKGTALFQQQIGESLVYFPNHSFPWLPVDIPKGYKLRHDLCSEVIARELGFEDGFSSVLGAHHGLPQSEMGNPDFSPFGVYKKVFFGSGSKQDWMEIWQEMVCVCLQAVGLEGPEDIPEMDGDLLLVLSGLLVAADWISSNSGKGGFPLIPLSREGDVSDYPGRVDRAMEALGFSEFWESDVYAADDVWFAERFGFEPYPLQSDLLKIVSEMDSPGLIIVEDQMGSGKTEAALACCQILGASLGMGGVYFGLPTRATADSMFSRFVSWAGTLTDHEKNSLLLSHGKADLNLSYVQLVSGGQHSGNEELFREPRFLLRKKVNLLGNFVVGTVDGLLMAVLEQRHVMLKHLGMSSKILVIDEVHAYDCYTSQYLDRLLEWAGAYGLPVILLSATLPANRKQALVNAYLQGRSGWEYHPTPLPPNSHYPMVTYTNGQKLCLAGVGSSLQPYCVAVSGIAQSRLDQTDMVQVIEDLKQGGCVGIIVNSVLAAQQLANRFRSLDADGEIVVVHARFTDEDRKKLELMLLQRIGKADAGLEEQAYRNRKGLLVIGTQVLEQSLDIDFDRLYTEAAPMDLLLQRIGRLHRHAANKHFRPECFRRPECIVFGTDLSDTGTKSIYDEWILRQTVRLLPEKIRIPDEIPVLVNQVYSAQPDVNDPLWTAYEVKQQQSRIRADTYRVERPAVLRDEMCLDGLFADKEIGSADGEKAVRDGGMSLEVILVKRVDETLVCNPSDEKELFDMTRIPDDLEAKRLERFRISLGIDSSRQGWLFGKLLEELEKHTASMVPDWSRNPRLRGELVMVLDRNGCAHFKEVGFRYSSFTGLERIRKEGEE